MTITSSRRSAADVRFSTARDNQRGWTAGQCITAAVAGAMGLTGLLGAASLPYACWRHDWTHRRDDVRLPYPGRPESAAAAQLQPPTLAALRLDLAQTGTWGRSDACPATDVWSPCIVHLQHPPEAPEPVLTLMTNRVWRNCRISTCGGFNGFNGDPVTLSYTFDQSHADATQYFRDTRGRALHPYASTPRSLARTAMAEISRYANLHFVEVHDLAPANIYHVMPDGSVGAGGYARIPTHNHTWVSVAPEYAHSFRIHAHETAHAAGPLRDPYAEGPSPVRLPVAGWQDRTIDTLMASQINHGDDRPASRLRTGPLELAVFAYNYGLAPALRGDTVHPIDADFGIAGIHDDSGINTLLAIGHDNVHVDLRTGGEASCVGQAFVRLSPTSTFQIADVSQTSGGILVGNALDNALLGSAGSDTFWLGGGNTYIRCGGGQDDIVLTGNARNVTIEGFDPEHTRLAANFPVRTLAMAHHATHVQVTINNQVRLILMAPSPLTTLRIKSIGADIPAPACDMAAAFPSTQPNMGVLYSSLGMIYVAGMALTGLAVRRTM